MRHSERLERIPPYLFAQLERKIAAKRAAGIDVITLGIGDPDTPTFRPIVEAAQRAVANPSTHTYPSNRGREEFREAVASFYGRRFGVTLDHDPQRPAQGRLLRRVQLRRLRRRGLDAGQRFRNTACRGDLRRRRLRGQGEPGDQPGDDQDRRHRKRR